MLLGKAKKEYYYKLLDDNIYQINGIWGIFNSVINNGSGRARYPRYFIDKDREILNMNDVADSLNKFFVNVGP